MATTMNSFGVAILSGIVSGLIATFLALVARIYWSLAIVPWYEERIYRDARIEGKWRSTLVKYSKGADDWDGFCLKLRDRAIG
jgi:hypothetical protein